MEEYMKKSVAGFVLGLIGSLFSLLWGFIFGVGGDIGGAATGTGANTFMILGWLCFLGGIAGIIGASFCLKKAQKGAIALGISTVACGALQVYLFINALQSGTPFMTLVVVFLLPTILMAAGTICAFAGQKYQPQNHGAQAVQPQQAVPQAAQAQPAEKTLEEELTNLKAMFDKQLLTEEEYAQAKKNALDKHTK